MYSIILTLVGVLAIWATYADLAPQDFRYVGF